MAGLPASAAGGVLSVIVPAFFDLTEPTWVYVSLPLAAAAVGYITKLLMIEMMFRPLEFKGLLNPWLGWQGQVPRRAAKMAATTVDALTESVLKPEELLDRIDADELLAEIETSLQDSLAQIAEDVVDRLRPGLWSALPAVARRALIARIERQAPQATRRILDSVRENFDQVFDLKHTVVTSLVRDKRLLCRLFRGMGQPEFRFMSRAGLLFGFVIGLGQMLTLMATGSDLVLPLFGLLTGGLTDYLALQMIFRPQEPGRFLGVLPWQGTFHKRRDQVVQDYAALMATEILSPKTMMEGLLTGPMSDRLFELIQREVQLTIDEQQSALTRPLVVMAIGGRNYMEMKQHVAQLVVERMPEAMQVAEDYADRVLDLQNLIVERMALLDTEQYEGILRPIFKDDEWVIVAVGATLGFVIGELQVHLLLS